MSWSLFAGAVPPSLPGKQLIEYGWDVPTPARMREELAPMEKRPFDGLIFRLSGGHNAFVTQPYDFSLWNHAKQPQAKARTFAEHRAKVRRRGAQLMRAFESPMPGATILTFFHVSLDDRWATLPRHGPKTERRGVPTAPLLIRP